MTEVISVRFRGGCKNYYFDPRGMQVRMGDQVIVETAAGIEFATCTQGNHSGRRGHRQAPESRGAPCDGQ